MEGIPMNRLRQIVVFLLLATGGVAWASDFLYSAPTYANHQITINAEKIWYKKDKVWFKLRVLNGTDKVLTFDKEQIQAKTPDGRVMSRERSVFAGQAKPSTVMPGGSADLWVEYKVGSVPVEVSLQLDHGFVLNGKPLSLPRYTAKPLGK
jgi:hypothetical protein